MGARLRRPPRGGETVGGGGDFESLAKRPYPTGPKRKALGQMHAVGVESHGQSDIRPDQEHEAASAANPGQSAPCIDSVGGAKSSIDNARALWEPRGDRHWIGRASRISEQQHRRQALSRARLTP